MQYDNCLQIKEKKVYVLRRKNSITVDSHI